MSRPKLVVTRPPLPKLVSRLPASFRRARPNWLPPPGSQVVPATTNLPSAWRAPVWAVSLPPKSTVALPPVAEAGVEAAIGVVARHQEIQVGGTAGRPGNHKLAIG